MLKCLHEPCVFVVAHFTVLPIRFIFISDKFPFSAVTLLVGRQKGHPACEKLDVGLLVVTIWLELCTSYSSSCHHSPPPSSLAPIKSRMERFWYRLIQAVLEEGPLNDQSFIPFIHSFIFTFIFIPFSSFCRCVILASFCERCVNTFVGIYLPSDRLFNISFSMLWDCSWNQGIDWLIDRQIGRNNDI